MPYYVLGNFLVYCVINAFTPGPGNILALNTVTNYGLKRGKALFGGIFTGYYVVQFLCAVFTYGVSTFLPNVMAGMKYIGAVYIFWLAAHIALSKLSEENDGRSASFMKGFMLQFINVKIYMFGITAITGFIAPYYAGFTAFLAAEFIIATIGSIATGTWIVMGMFIQKLYMKHYRAVNILLSLALGECIFSMLT
ncbi:MAG: LysE family transporter [Bacillota bacterium]|nr:LysE family transporter [Bacillota bacterium]